MVLHLEFAIWTTWQKCQAVDGFVNPIARAKSRARKTRASGDLLFLFFVKSKCQFPWRWPIFIFCILLWEFANNNKCQVNLPKPLEMLYIFTRHVLIKWTYYSAMAANKCRLGFKPSLSLTRPAQAANSASYQINYILINWLMHVRI